MRDRLGYDVTSITEEDLKTFKLWHTTNIKSQGFVFEDIIP